MLDIYIARIPGDVEICDVYPDERNKEILNVRNKSVKTEKYCAWKLLSLAVEQTMGKPINSYIFLKFPNGKWVCDDFYFSLSHSDGIVTVAISDASVGVDVQRIKSSLSEKMSKRIMTAQEYEKYLSVGESDKEAYFTSLWSKKEAIYKRGGYESFIPSAIDTFENNSSGFEHFENGIGYYIAYSSHANEQPNLIFTNI